MQNLSSDDEFQTIPIVFCADDNYAKFAAVTIQSIIENKNQNCFYNIFILGDEDLQEHNRIILENMSQDNLVVKCLDVSGLISKNDLYSRAHYSKQMFYRWLIPEVLPQYEKVIYLDCDILVKSDLQELFNIDLEEQTIAAARDMTTNDKFNFYIKEDLKIDPNKYINSGVLLINNKKFIDDEIKNKCLKVLKKHTAFLCPDQDALNIVLVDKTKHISYLWNFQCGSFEKSNIEEIKNNIKIIHYTSSIKPWKENVGKLPFVDDFWYYAEKTPFLKDILEGKQKKKEKKVKKHKKFVRALLFPFRLIKRFFKMWKDFGFKNAVHEIVFEMKYVLKK